MIDSWCPEWYNDFLNMAMVPRMNEIRAYHSIITNIDQKKFTIMKTASLSLDYHMGQG